MLYLLSGMCMRTASRPFFGAIALLIIALSSCDVGSSLYTEEELDRLFDVRVTHDGTRLEQGARLVAGQALEASVTSDSDARLASSLELRLAGADGIEAAAVRFSTAGRPDSVLVPSITGQLPSFALPEDLADGYYALTAVIKDGAGETLSSTTTVVLVYEGRFDPPVLAAYPGGAVPGRVSLLRIETSFPEGLDPWIRWIADGSERDAGFLSERRDRLAWKAPAANGIYAVRVEVFPFKPPAGLKTPAFAKADIRIPVSQAAPSAAWDEGWALFRFDGSLVDDGSRPDAGRVSVIGEPYLETYATGYGYVLGAGAGLSSESPLAPLDESGSRALPFSASFTLAPLPGSGDDRATGRLLSFESPKGELVLGLVDGFPYLALGDGEPLLGDARLAARAGSLSRLAFYLGDGSVRFYIDDRPAGQASLPEGALDASSSGWRLGGEGGYQGVYDEARVLAGPWPAYRLAEEAAKGRALVAASGFEGGILGSGLDAEGEVRLSHGRAILEPGAALRLGPGEAPKGGLALTLSILEGRAKAVVRLEDGSLLELGTDGSLSVGGTLALPVSGTKPVTGQASAVVEALSDGLRVTGFDGREYLAAGVRLARSARLGVLNAGEEALVIGSASAYEPSSATFASRQKAPGDARPGRLTIAAATDAALSRP